MTACATRLSASLRIRTLAVFASGPEPIAYMPMKPPRAFTMYVRSTLDPASVLKLAQREAKSLGPG